MPHVLTGGLEFKFWTGQILHSFANASPSLQHLRTVAVMLWHCDAELGTANSLHASA